MKFQFLVSALVLSLHVFTYAQTKSFKPYKDLPFAQETHTAHPLYVDGSAIGVNQLALTKDGHIWAATMSGVFVKKHEDATWEYPTANERINGPVFSLIYGIDQQVFAGTWQGLFTVSETGAVPLAGIPETPISILSYDSKGNLYAFGPDGGWKCEEHGCEKLSFSLPQSIRSAKVGPDGAWWVASDVGLYRFTGSETHHLYEKGTLISAYLNGLDWDRDGILWVSGLGGVSKLRQLDVIDRITTEKGLPTPYTTCIAQSPDGTFWVGTERGVVRYYTDGSHSLRFSKRWLVNDHVTSILFDEAGNAWIGTQKGVSCIKAIDMTLAEKEAYFYQTLMERHIREPWTAGQVRLLEAGNLDTWVPEDDDNDGEYTSMYLAMESFRYAATGSADAREKAGKAFRFLKKLEEITGRDGFFARSIVPPDWEQVHDPNSTYTPQEMAIRKVKEPRYKPVETRWHLSADGKWKWKGDTSSDEMCGHMFGYFIYYQLVADETEKSIIRSHVSKILDHLLRHDFSLTDLDGKPTRWGVWSPDQLNRNPEWLPDRALNSMEMLGFLKFGYFITQNQRYQDAYLHLIEKEGYLENMGQIKHQNPAWFIYFDVMLASYIYPLLIFGEEDPALKSYYEQHMDDWFEDREGDQNPLINFIYSYTRGKREGLAASVAFLKDTPLDLIDWVIDHRQREDIRLTRSPVLEDLQVDPLQPPSLRAVVRWDKNPWDALSGNPFRVREPVFWLLPYWMGRYLQMIE
ncbi:ligand-binding sensor domain-containing protein [Lunatimonas salinarum]|uniref:ligand-binding sensor domain-containing protein n=1 Tax=Lunatimonas salinarum TaxID=1774590 RepID=UPI001AE048C2|nr:two-component regulator propeller domain-containing protein [Lunatimonas salinarum]